MTDFKPMLAATVKDREALRFPLLASPKLDGVRAIVRDGVVLSRNLKPIPNDHVQRTFSKLEGLDGELILGPPNAKDVFLRTVSAVKRTEGRPEVAFWAFDRVPFDGADWRFHQRLEQVERTLKKVRLSTDLAAKVPHYQIGGAVELQHLEDGWLAFGYEGVILRDPSGLYKHGRSTLKEHGLLKLKQFEDAEAKIIGFEELMHNANEATTNELGAKSRSSHKAGLVGRGTLGALMVVGVNGTYKGVEFKIGTGFDAAARDEIWGNRAKWFHQVIKYKYFAKGAKDAPRFPVYLGPRPGGL